MNKQESLMMVVGGTDRTGGGAAHRELGFVVGNEPQWQPLCQRSHLLPSATSLWLGTT